MHKPSIFLDRDHGFIGAQAAHPALPADEILGRSARVDARTSVWKPQGGRARRARDDGHRGAHIVQPLCRAIAVCMLGGTWGALDVQCTPSASHTARAPAHTHNPHTHTPQQAHIASHGTPVRPHTHGPNQPPSCRSSRSHSTSPSPLSCTWLAQPCPQRSTEPQSRIKTQWRSWWCATSHGLTSGPSLWEMWWHSTAPSSAQGKQRVYWWVAVVAAWA